MHSLLTRLARPFAAALVLLACLSFCPSRADEISPPVRLLAGWFTPAASDSATAATPGVLVLHHPASTRGWHNRGFRVEHDGAADFRPYAGLRLELSLPDDRPVELAVTLRVPAQPVRVNYVPATTAKVVLRGRGPHTVMLPWSAFDFQQAQPAFLKFIEQIELAARHPDTGAPTPASYAGLALIQGETLALRAEVRGRSAPAGGAVSYAVAVANCTDRRQAVALSRELYGWEAMRIEIMPATLELAPGQSAMVEVRVTLPATLPPGFREKQFLRAVANGDGTSAATLELVTASAVPHPYVLHTPARWAEVKAKVADHEWAAKAQAGYVARATKWKVPDLATKPVSADTYGLHLFATQVENDLMDAGVAYQLTGERVFAEKIREFMLRLSDPVRGYPSTLRGCNQGLVQEGHFFQHIAMAYDMALPSGLFTDADRALIEKTFRAYLETIDFETNLGAINNWNLSEICGALYSALVLQDLAVAGRYLDGPGGITDQLGKGVLDDGWWYECSISYNVWCATEFSQAALALEPWGVNLRDMRVPVGAVPNFSIVPWARSRQYGMSFDKWGPVTRPYVDIKRMWDALPNFTDYRGVMFGVNDATERRLTGDAYEIAYYLYRDPAYATLIKQGGGQRDLLYGVPELPEKTPEKFRDSAYADNVGVALLRSQTPDRPMREQIQAVLHYGTHGGYHGHFDRTGLLHLSRYGRSFYNPEAVWYSYAPYMYKFYVQNSTSKNMVVVDRKMQEPVESRRLLFHSGKLMQAAAAETLARWSAPPYGGMEYPEQGYATLSAKAFGEGRHLPLPENPPAYGEVTAFTEPVLQRRLLVVTDDYVLLADYLKGEREHTFENLLQMKGFKGVSAAGAPLAPARHEAQWETNPILDAQFVTDVDWYRAAAPAKAGFEMRWGPGADNEGTRAPESEPGVLKLDVHSLWPREQTLFTGTMPEPHPVEKRLFWSVRGDGRELASGKFGAWILGQEQLDLDIAGLTRLELETRVELSKRPTVFWASARVVLRDGRELPLSSLKPVATNLAQPPEAGKDFFGGPVKIVGTLHADSVSGQPQDVAHPGVLRLDLSGLDAVRFKAVLGGDFPLGDETARRRTYGSQVTGTEARFLTLIEPYETDALVRRAEATGPDTLRVELADGRVQELTLKNFSGTGADLGVEIRETAPDGATRSETTP